MARKVQRDRAGRGQPGGKGSRHGDGGHGSEAGDESSANEAPRLPAAPARLSSPFAALKGVQLAPPAPPAPPTKPPAPAASSRTAARPTPSSGTRAAPGPSEGDAQGDAHTPSLPGRDYAERIAIGKAYAGVRPLGSADAPRIVRRAAKSPQQVAELAQRDAEARARLDAFVGQAQRFVVEREGDEVRGRRDDLSPARAAHLFARGAVPERKLDLHGLRADDAARQVVHFVRSAQRGGKRVVLIVHGRGQHSAGGVGVLPEVVLETLSRGGAAPVVQAFVSAPQRLGGSGALLVFLAER